MKKIPYLAAAAFDLLDPRVLLRAQTDLVTGEISDGEQYVFAYGSDHDDPAVYLHLTTGVCRLTVRELIESMYRALAARAGETMTPLEALPADDPRHHPRFTDTVAGMDLEDETHYLNSLYYVVRQTAPDAGVALLVRRRDGQPVIDLRHAQTMVTTLVDPDVWKRTMIPTTNDGGWWALYVAPPPPPSTPNPRRPGGKPKE